MFRKIDLQRLYTLLDELKLNLGGYRRLDSASGRLSWPARGVYFFFESGEVRSDSGDGARIVRVGTHALTARSRTSLWNRLSQHKGVASTGGGNHRGSIFRLIVGTALMSRDSALIVESWGQGSTAKQGVRIAEQGLERMVSREIGQMPFLWLAVEDDPGPNSLMAVIERNSIALLSNYEKPSIDPPSSAWLGHECNRERVRRSGIWNQNHVNETYDASFLEALQQSVEQTGA